MRVSRPRDRHAPLPSGRHRAALCHHAAPLARAFFRQSRGSASIGLFRHVHPHVGVLSLLLRGGVCRTLSRRRATDIHETALPPRPDFRADRPPRVTI